MYKNIGLPQYNIKKMIYALTLSYPSIKKFLDIADIVLDEKYC